MTFIKVEKEGCDELPVPSVWRDTIRVIVAAIVDGDYHLENTPDNIIALDKKSAEINAENIESYPDVLRSLHDTTWNTSICQWANGYWQLLIDLSVCGGETSDLVLHIKVKENGNTYIFEPGLIYVP